MSYILLCPEGWGDTLHNPKFVTLLNQPSPHRCTRPWVRLDAQGTRRTVRVLENNRADSAQHKVCGQTPFPELLGIITTCIAYLTDYRLLFNKCVRQHVKC